MLKPLVQSSFCSMLAASKKFVCGSPAAVLTNSANSACPHWPKAKLIAAVQKARFATSFAASVTSQPSRTPAAAAQEYVYEEEYGVGEVDWNAQLINAVSLVGRLGRAIEVKNVREMRVANCSLAVRNGADKPASWFDIEIWGPLADVAAGELAKGDMVQVLGRLRSNEYVTREGVKQKSMRVAVNNINRVRPYAPDQARSPSWDAMASQVQAEQPLYEDQTAGMPGWGAETPLQQPQATKQGGKEQQWDHLLKNFNEYYDNRGTKRNPKGPDFKHKQSGEALWLSSAPSWVQRELDDNRSAVSAL